MMSSIQLRDIREEDLSSLFEHQNDPKANQMAAFPARSKDAFIKHWKEKVFANTTSTKKTILKNNEIVGYITCWQQEGKHLVGYWIGQKYWGQGIASQALSAFLPLLKHRPLNAYVAKHNLASVRVLEKCGFKVSGQDSFFSEALGYQVEELIMHLD